MMRRTRCRVSAAARRKRSQAEKAARCCGRTHAASAAASPAWRSRSSATAPCTRDAVPPLPDVHWPVSGFHWSTLIERHS